MSVSRAGTRRTPGAQCGRLVEGLPSVMGHSSFAPRTPMRASALTLSVRDVLGIASLTHAISLSGSVGTGLLLCFRDNGATHTLSIDGRQVEPNSGDNDAACRELGATTTLRTGDLDFARHSVLLDVAASDNHQFEFYGGAMDTRVAVDRCGLHASNTRCAKCSAERTSP